MAYELNMSVKVLGLKIPQFLLLLADE